MFAFWKCISATLSSTGCFLRGSKTMDVFVHCFLYPSYICVQFVVGLVFVRCPLWILRMKRRFNWNLWKKTFSWYLFLFWACPSYFSYIKYFLDHYLFSRNLCWLVQPPFLETKNLASINLWMNITRSRSSTHYDPHHNLLCMVAGCKKGMILNFWFHS